MSRVPLPTAEAMKLTRLAEIARGGMGSVELARVEDGRLAGQVVAIKRLHPNIANDPQFVSMFLDEAWLTAALKHPNVVAVAAWGNDDRGMFLAIEFVEGVSLHRLLKEARQNHEPFAERTVANLCSQICGGLTAAHGLRGADGALLGLVHRDLTPGNVLVRFDGVVKIVDFGIAKAEERITHTQTGMLKGKPAYMAPEQARGGHVDQRADIFSFGVLMFELLAGRKPWTSKAAFDVMMEIANDPVPDLAALRPGLNPEFIAIINKCLEKKPENRFTTAAEIQARLDAWRQQKGFTGDDQQSLGAFVVRNSTAQIKWFEDALRGELARTEAPTFKELEEKIDAEREAKTRPPRKAPPPRPAAGRPAAPPLPPAAGRPAAPPAAPTPVPAAPPSSGPLAAPPPSSRPAAAPPPSSGPLAAPPPSSGPAAAPPKPEAPPPSSAGAKLLAGGGTEYMAISPFATGAALPALPRPPSAPPPPVSARYPAAPVSAGPPPSSMRQPGPPLPSAPAVNSATLVAGSRPKAPTSTWSLVLIFALALLFGAGAVLAWQYRAHLGLFSPPPAPAVAPSK